MLLQTLLFSKEDHVMSNQNTPDMLLRVCCAITSTDPELVIQCAGVLERSMIFRHALALLLTFIITTGLWSSVFSHELPLWAAIACGTLVGLIVYMLDLSMSTSDWDMKGVLAEPATASMAFIGRSIVRLVKIVVRFTIAFVFAMVTGTYVTLFFFNSSLNNYLHDQRQAYNAPIEADYNAASERLHAETIIPVQREHQAAMKNRDASQRHLEQLQAAHQEKADAASNARIEMTREEGGLNRPAGRGPRYEDAKTRFEEASRHVAHILRDIDSEQVRLDEVENRIAAIGARIREANATFEANNAALIVDRNARLMPTSSDFLMKVIALEALMADETSGNAVKLTSLISKILLIVIEMFFFIMMLNDHASTYQARVIARTKIDYHDINKEYVADIERINEKYRSTGGIQQAAGYQEESGSSTDNNGDSTRKPLFDPAPETDRNSVVTGNESSGENHAPDDAPTCKDNRHPVIGGASDERVTTSEALANRNRYWVNPDRPNEIWVRQFHDELQGTAGGQPA